MQSLASNHVLHARTKHIELDIHFVHDKVLAKEIELRHVPSMDQIADIFTKPLGRKSFEKLRSKLGITSLASLGLRGRVEDQPQDDQVDTKVASVAALHEGDSKCGHVKASGARDIARTHSMVVGKSPAVNVDHKRTWLDVAIQGAMKK